MSSEFFLLLDVFHDTYLCMKKTVEIPDSLLKEARKLASRERTPLKALAVESMQKVIAERKRRGGFKLGKATFKGKGLQPHMAGAPWDRIRDMAFERRGA